MSVSRDVLHGTALAQQVSRVVVRIRDVDRHAHVRPTLRVPYHLHTAYKC